MMHSSGDCSSNGTQDASQGYIEHQVSKLDTLAGIAIKYGVEVVDVKRANGLVTDLQMFAHKTLKIPLPGRKPQPSRKYGVTRMSGLPPQGKSATGFTSQTGKAQNIDSRHKDKRPLSSAMNLLRGYYGLSTPAQQMTNGIEGMELTSYRSDGEDHSEEEPFSPLTKPLENEWGYIPNGSKHTEQENKEGLRVDSEYVLRDEIVPILVIGDASERAVRRRSKMEIPNGLPEVESRQDMGAVDRIVSSSAFPSSINSSGKTAGLVKALDGPLLGGKGKEVPISKVIKSFSASNLQDQTSLQAISVDPKYGSKIDVKSSNQTISNQVSTRSLFEGLSRPVGQRYKAALD